MPAALRVRWRIKLTGSSGLTSSLANCSPDAALQARTSIFRRASGYSGSGGSLELAEAPGSR